MYKNITLQIKEYILDMIFVQFMNAPFNLQNSLQLVLQTLTDECYIPDEYVLSAV